MASNCGSPSMVISAVELPLAVCTWTFASPAPLTFVRERIGVDYVRGDLAVLFSGPPAGTRVVTVGAAELLGAELGVGGE